MIRKINSIDSIDSIDNPIIKFKKEIESFCNRCLGEGTYAYDENIKALVYRVNNIIWHFHFYTFQDDEFYISETYINALLEHGLNSHLFNNLRCYNNYHVVANVDVTHGIFGINLSVKINDIDVNNFFKKFMFGTKKVSPLRLAKYLNKRLGKQIFHFNSK